MDLEWQSFGIRKSAEKYTGRITWYATVRLQYAIQICKRRILLRETLSHASNLAHRYVCAQLSKQVTYLFDQRK